MWTFWGQTKIFLYFFTNHKITEPNSLRLSQEILVDCKGERQMEINLEKSPSGLSRSGILAPIDILSKCNLVYKQTDVQWFEGKWNSHTRRTIHIYNNTTGKCNHSTLRSFCDISLGEVCLDIIQWLISKPQPSLAHLLKKLTRKEFENLRKLFHWYWRENSQRITTLNMLWESTFW